MLLSISSDVWALVVTLVGGVYTVWKFRHYVRDIALGTVFPSRVSWSVWMATTVIAVASAVVAGATAGLVVAGSAAISVGGVLAASFLPAGLRARLRERAGLPRATAVVDVRSAAQVWTDRVCLSLSGLTLAAWAVLSVVDVPDSALYALIAITATDGIAAVPTLARAWRGEEDAAPFVGFAASAVATFLVLTELTPPNVIYPAYQLTICTVIAVICVLRTPVSGGAHRAAESSWTPHVRGAAAVGSGAVAILGMVALLVGIVPVPASSVTSPDGAPAPVPVAFDPSAPGPSALDPSAAGLALDPGHRTGDGAAPHSTHHIAPAAAGSQESAAIPSFRGPALPVGPTPGFVTLTPSQRQAWIAHGPTGVVSVLDVASGRLVTEPLRIPAGPPRFITFCPDGRRAYVSVHTDGNPDAPHVVAVLDVASVRQIAEIPVGRRPWAAACSADGTRLVVPSHDDGVLDVVDTGTNAVIARVDVPDNPHWVAVGPDGRWWTANHESNSATVLTADLSQQTVVALDSLAGARPCQAPHSIAVSRDGSKVAVACFASAQVYLLDGLTGAPVAAVDVGNGPQAVTWTPDGRRVWSTDVHSGVSVVDVASRARTAVLTADDARAPTSVAITRDGTTGYVTNLDSGSLSIADAAVPQER